MFCVLFEVEMRLGKEDAYFAIANALRPELTKVPGFIYNERYEDLGKPGSYLSYSTWESERALIRWRTHAKHHHSQSKGRADIFEDYRIRIGALAASTEEPAPHCHDPEQLELTEASPIKSVLVTEYRADGPQMRDAAADAGDRTRHLRSIVREGFYIELTGWSATAKANDYLGRVPGLFPGSFIQARHFSVIRDYSLVGRDEAPQYYPKVRREGDQTQGAADTAKAVS